MPNEIFPLPSDAAPPPVPSPERRMGQAAFYGLALLVIVLDQAVKAAVRRNVPVGGTIAVWPDVFHLTHTQNSGMAFSLLEGATGVLITAALFVMAVIIWVQRRHGKSLPALLGVALALPLGGAAGNLIDRVLFGYVTDLFDFLAIHFPVFNVADAAITVGVGLLAFRTLMQKEEPIASAALEEKTPSNPPALAGQE